MEVDLRETLVRAAAAAYRHTYMRSTVCRRSRISIFERFLKSFPQRAHGCDGWRFVTPSWVGRHRVAWSETSGAGARAGESGQRGARAGSDGQSRRRRRTERRGGEGKRRAGYERGTVVGGDGMSSDGTGACIAGSELEKRVIIYARYHLCIYRLKGFNKKSIGESSPKIV